MIRVSAAIIIAALIAAAITILPEILPHTNNARSQSRDVEYCLDRYSRMFRPCAEIDRYEYVQLMATYGSASL